MKFGQHLLENIAAEYGPEAYIAYDRLDGMIRELSKEAPSRYDSVSFTRYAWTSAVFLFNTPVPVLVSGIGVVATASGVHNGLGSKTTFAIVIRFCDSIQLCPIPHSNFLLVRDSRISSLPVACYHFQQR